MTLHVAPGEIASSRRDGAGKTTLLQLAVGQLSPQDGRIRVLGRNAADPTLRDEIAHMPWGFGLYPDLTVQENLDFFADLHGLPRMVGRERIVELLRSALAWRGSSAPSLRWNNLSAAATRCWRWPCALVTTKGDVSG
ncbi:MAG: ATP-binding cassette domain-containing protein [Candidatus Competibacteraceae bacterium]